MSRAQQLLELSSKSDKTYPTDNPKHYEYTVIKDPDGAMIQVNPMLSFIDIKAFDKALRPVLMRLKDREAIDMGIFRVNDQEYKKTLTKWAREVAKAMGNWEVNYVDAPFGAYEIGWQNKDMVEPGKARQLLDKLKAKMKIGKKK